MNKKVGSVSKKIAKLLLALGFLFAAHVSRGQSFKGTQLVGGSINLIQSREYHGVWPYMDKLPYASVSARYLYFISDRIALGASVDYSASEIKFYTLDYTTGLLTHENRFSKKGYFIEPTARFYFAKKYFIQLALGFAANKETYDWNGASPTLDKSPLRWSARLGRAVFIDEGIAVEPAVSYAGYNETYKPFPIPAGISNSTSLSFGLNLQFYVNRKAKDSDGRSMSTETPIRKGTRIFGGPLSFSSANETTVPNFNYNSIYVNLSPQFFYFVTNKLAVGGTVSYALSRSEAEGKATYVRTVSDYMITPSFRFYFYKTLFFQPELSFGSSKGEEKYSSSTGIHTATYATKTSKFALSMGWAFFITRSVALESSVGYQSFSDSYSSDDPYYATHQQLPNGVSSSSNGLMWNMTAQLYLKRK